MVVLANARVFPYDQYVGADTGNIKIPGQAQSLRHADLFILDVENAGVLYIPQHGDFEVLDANIDDRIGKKVL